MNIGTPPFLLKLLVSEIRSTIPVVAPALEAPEALEALGAMECEVLLETPGRISSG